MIIWSCHICGEERPDEKISVFVKPLLVNGQVFGQQNIRYCNDKEECKIGVETFNFYQP